MKFSDVKISEIADFINGFSFKPLDWGNEGIPIIRIQNLTDSGKPYNLTTKSISDKYTVNNGDILVSWSATIDVFEWHGGKALLNQHIFKVLFDESKVDKQYFKRALKQTISELSKFSHGSTMKHVVKKDFENHRIPLPEIEDQKRIASLLGKVESLIHERKQSLDRLDELLKSVFLDMFGDPVRNEKGWRIDSLSTFGSFKNGLNFKKGESGEKSLYLGVGDFKSLYRLNDFSSLSTIDLDVLPTEDYFLKNGDILFVRSNGNKDLVGRCIEVYPNNERITFSGFCIKYKLEKEGVSSTYLTQLFRDKSFRKKILKGGQGANIQNINQKMLSELKIPTPPIELQIHFSRVVDKIYNLNSQYQKNLSDLEELYNALSQKAFSGELDLSRINLSDKKVGPSAFENLQKSIDAVNRIITEPVRRITETVNKTIPSSIRSLGPFSHLDVFGFKNAKARSKILEHWFNEWLADSQVEQFDLENFWQRAQSSLPDYLYEEDLDEFRFSVEDYDKVKDMLFQAIDNGLIHQTTDYLLLEDKSEAGNRVVLAKG